MAKKASLCSWKKEDISTDLEQLKKIVSKPKYICERCARVAKKETYLCRPLRIKKTEEGV